MFGGLLIAAGDTAGNPSRPGAERTGQSVRHDVALATKSAKARAKTAKTSPKTAKTSAKAGARTGLVAGLLTSRLPG